MKKINKWEKRFHLLVLLTSFGLIMSSCSSNKEEAKPSFINTNSINKKTGPQLIDRAEKTQILVAEHQLNKEGADVEVEFIHDFPLENTDQFQRIHHHAKLSHSNSLVFTSKPINLEDGQVVQIKSICTINSQSLELSKCSALLVKIFVLQDENFVPLRSYYRKMGQRIGEAFRLPDDKNGETVLESLELNSFGFLYTDFFNKESHFSKVRADLKKLNWIHPTKRDALGNLLRVRSEKLFISIPFNSLAWPDSIKEKFPDTNWVIQGKFLFWVYESTTAGQPVPNQFISNSIEHVRAGDTFSEIGLKIERPSEASLLEYTSGKPGLVMEVRCIADQCETMDVVVKEEVSDPDQKLRSVGAFRLARSISEPQFWHLIKQSSKQGLQLSDLEEEFAKSSD